jgi:uncharacterized membrane protein
MTETPARQPVRPGQTTGRVGRFTDGVLSIAITLLAIDLPRPQAADFETGNGVSKSQAFDRLWQFLVAERSEFYAYLLAFYIIWVLWREHHVLLDQVSRVSTVMIGWHFPLLLLSAFLPYTAIVLGYYSRNPLAALLFGLVVGALLLCRSGIQSEAMRGEVLLPDVDRHQYEASTRAGWVVTGYWTLTLPFIWWTPWVVIAWFMTVLVRFISSRVVTRRAAADRSDK